METDASSWIVANETVAPAFVLARQGYDVWLANTRGGIHSQQHLTLKPTEKEFWFFSWEEIGVYDLPAIIDHIVDETGYDKITYMGHSQGVTCLMAGSTLRPDYFNAKINLAINLAPPISMHYNNNTAWRKLTEPNLVRTIEKTAVAMNLLQWFPYNLESGG